LETDYYEGDVLLLSLYKKFLIGSQVCEKVQVNTGDQLKTLVQVALTHPTSLQELREVRYKDCLSYKLLYSECDDLIEMRDFLNMCMKVH
jgi:hypothetical protein